MDLKGGGGGVGGSRVITLLLVSHCKRGKREGGGGAVCVKMGFMRTFSRESRYNSRSKIKFW